MGITRKETASKVTAVTVYQGRAMVSRRATLDINAGDHVIIFTELPSDLDQNSIQVKGTGEATLGECVFDTEYFVEDVDEKRRTLLNKQQELEDALSEIQLNLEALGQEKVFVNKITNYITTPATIATGSGTVTAQSEKADLDADKWMKMISFYTVQLADIDHRSLQATQKSRKLQQELDKIYAEVDALGSSGQRSRNIVKVSITKKEKGSLTLDLSYIIYGPTWRPVYNVRASSDSDSMTIEYDALVNQSTGEYWEEAALKLSTARVNVSGVMPELSPWRLRIYTPMPVMRRAKKLRSADEEMDAMYPEAAKSAAAPSEMAGPEFEDELLYEQADIETGGTSVVFSVAGGCSIGGDNRDTRVTIMRRELPATFSYAAVPKLAEFAYLTANVKNATDYPMLPGTANIFFDGSFVATSEFSLIMPDQELEVSLGVDEGVQVEYRFIKQFKKNEGLMSKRTSEQFEYQIRITNNKKKKIEIKVYDQIPIAEEKDITVKMIKPAIKDGQKDITLDDESKIQWHYELSEGEKRELPFIFLVEYPVGSSLSGFY